MNKWHETIGHVRCTRSFLRFGINKQYNVFSSLRTKNSLSFKNGKQTYEIFKNANNILSIIIYIYIYIYIYNI